jgi:hypothetical protein
MKRATSIVTAIALAAAVLPAGGCASEYTVVDRSALVVSDNARVAAASMLPGAARNPRAANHLALAQEVYQKQLDLLKERRNKVRARRRALGLLSFGTLVASSLVVGSIVLAGTTPEHQRYAGGAAMSGVGLGTGLEIGGLMQEDASTVDGKIRHLEQAYDAMIERVRTLAVEPATEQNDAVIGATIEAFINEALQINVKG